jgi:hypothetical protein
MELTLNSEGHEIKATRRDIGTFSIVAIEWRHPNWSYFSDAMIWVNSLHLQRWLPVAISECSKKYSALDEFLRDFPQFSSLFSEM